MWRPWTYVFSALAAMVVTAFMLEAQLTPKLLSLQAASLSRGEGEDVVRMSHDAVAVPLLKVDVPLLQHFADTGRKGCTGFVTPDNGERASIALVNIRQNTTASLLDAVPTGEHGPSRADSYDMPSFRQAMCTCCG